MCGLWAAQPATQARNWSMVGAGTQQLSSGTTGCHNASPVIRTIRKIAFWGRRSQKLKWLPGWVHGCRELCLGKEIRVCPWSFLPPPFSLPHLCCDQTWKNKRLGAWACYYGLPQTWLWLPEAGRRNNDEPNLHKAILFHFCPVVCLWLLRGFWKFLVICAFWAE